MAESIDRLEIQVEAQATKANNQLDKLVTKLDRVSGALSRLNSGGLTGLSNGVAKFSKASAQLSNVKTADFTRLTKNIERLSNLNSRQLYGASHAMRTLANSMNSFGNVSASSADVAEFASSVGKLGGASVQRAIANLPALGNAMNDLMTTLSRAPQVSDNIIRMTAALAGLAAQGSKVGTVSNSLTKDVNRVGSVMSVNAKKSKGLASIIGSMYQKFYWVSRGINKLWDSIENSMGYVETLNYFDAALGQVAENAVSKWQDAGYDSADAYYESFSSRAKELTSKMTGFNIDDDGTLTASGSANLGINPSKLMNYQATFAQMSSSMGVASETSLKLSQALTEIGADLASVKNMDFDKVWTDMASGLAGMSRTLDKYGANIRNVNLQQKLFDLGINENITNLNQNDKALLRAIILLDSTKYAWGDLADTLEQPANQMRLLESNLSNLARTLGNLFLPAISHVLPYVNGLVIAVQRLLAWVGSLMNIDLSSITSSIGSSEIDMSELLGDTEDLTGNLDNASDSAKKLKNNLLGIDELNVLSPQDESGTTGTGANLSSGLLDEAFENAFSEYQKAWDEAFANMENRANDFADKVEGYLLPIKNLISDFAIGDFFKAGQDTSNIVAGIFDFFSNAIENVDWNQIGNNIGEHLEGIEWKKVFGSVGNFVETAIDAAIEMWGGTFNADPIATIIVSALGIAKFTGVDKKIKDGIIKELETSGLSAGTAAVGAGFAIAGTLYVAFEFAEGAKEWWENIQKYGWDEGRRKTAEENPANPYRNGRASVQEDGTGWMNAWLDKLKAWQEENKRVRELEKAEIAQWGETLKKRFEEVGNYFSLLFSKDAWTDAFENIGLTDFVETMKSRLGEAKDYIGLLFSEEAWSEQFDNIGRALETKWEEIEEWWKDTAISKWWNEDVAPWFNKDKWTFAGIKDGLGTAFESAIEAMKKIWNGFATWLNDALTFEFGGFYKDLGLLGSVDIPAFEISLGVLPTFNTGGFPEDGLFMANHNELVGRFSNGRTAVVNNEQIDIGIKHGVKEAVAEILAPYLAEIAQNTRETADKDLSVNIGDRDIARANARGQREMGARLIHES